MVGRVAPRAPVWDVECGARGAARPTFRLMVNLRLQLTDPLTPAHLSALV